MNHVEFDLYSSPAGEIGELFVAAHEQRLCFLDFNENQERIRRLLTRRFGDYRLNRTNNLLGMGPRLDRYFQGHWDAFDGLPLSVQGTGFQERVWSSLQTIPAGQTWSYGQLAQDVGSPRAIRAAGSANARNPISLVIPCHRVIGRNGDMRGYAGGVDRQAWLLRHEGALI